MDIRYIYFWKWGDKSTILYNTQEQTENAKKLYNGDITRVDLCRVIRENREGTGYGFKDIYSHTWEYTKELAPSVIAALLGDCSGLDSDRLAGGVRDINNAIAELQQAKQTLALLSAQALMGEGK